MSTSEIPGVNMDAGLDLYGGEMDIYMGALKSFAANTLSALDKIRNVSEKRLPDYAIAVHGIKSISATIAAENISERAKKLEAMAKNGDFSGVSAINAEFIKDTETLVSEIKKWLELNA